MQEAGVTTYSTERPNWLLLGLVILSLGVHALVLARVTGMYRPVTTSYIEIEMRTEEKPSGRSIPVPPPRHKVIKPRLHAQAIKPISPVSVAKPIMPPQAPQPTAVQPAVVEPITAPKASDISKSADNIDRQVVNVDKEAASTPVKSSSIHGSAKDYLGMVRMMIEKHKRYPYAARKRQIQGQVVVRFVIGDDGTVTNLVLAGSSHHRLLDEAALAAVRDASPFPRPPAHLFDSPVPLEICIVFELM